MKKVTILGAGVMGSAMTLPFVDRGLAVHLVGTHLDEDIITSVKAKGFHPKLKVTLPASVKAFSHLEFGAALGSDTDLILLGVSSAGVDWAVERLLANMTKPVPVLMITKGMRPGKNTLSTLPEVVSTQLHKKFGVEVPVAAIGGPCIAGELAVKRQTGTVIVSKTTGFAESLCRDLETPYYHPRASSDMIGVETCAAFKNFFAIGVGWAHGAMARIGQAENGAQNNNAAAVIFDQAVREMMTLTKTLKGDAESVWGMPGVGDLYVTCQAGRNSRLGNALGRGLTYREALAGPLKGETVEGADLGISTAEALRAMFASNIVPKQLMPLTAALLNALTNNTPLDIAWQSFHRTS
jgi:glycerol-3-phosphate dehydrogenase (NAD(P)+)